MLMHNRVVATLAGATILVGGANVVAYAGNGGSFALDHTNHAASTAKKKATRLHTDRMDGRKAGHRMGKAYTFRVPKEEVADDFTLSLPGIPKGVYLVTYTLRLDEPGGVLFDCMINGGNHPPYGEVNNRGDASNAYAMAHASVVINARKRRIRGIFCGNTSVTHLIPRLSSISVVRLGGYHHARAVLKG